MTVTGILDIALIIAFVSASLAQIIAMIRLLKGPCTGDRILAIDTMTVNAIALIVLLGLAGGTGLYFEGALLFAMLGFVSTVAYARFVLRGDIIE
ncbi:K+/H+ antiporter subunit F [Palleronia abyssalis]|uniref:Na(+)/H(+) antiporter subunit F n=1 Tax=Palleronia abyssalis TaxID=1501240 RepID=A0A2R8BT00_9RHOB|nr:K+/H+ antiporter subunit F [Palleronia abyssalis]SPJ23271.1 Na(+)/H(+) antiporter subunit F [Palleronia abyssalis]